MIQVREGKEKDRDSIKRLFWKAWHTPGAMEEIPWWNKLENDASAEVTLSEYKLSQVIAGKYQAATLLELGELDCSVSVAEKLEIIFHKDNFMSIFRF